MRALKLYLTSAVAMLVLSSSHAFASSLEEANVFAIGGIGVTGATSDGEKALRAVLGQSDAITRLEKLLPHASSAGQLYILLGLRLRDPEAYKRARASCAEREGSVETIRGCMVGHEAFGNLVREIDSGRFDVLLKEPTR
jgi:hypothetical protein